MQDHEAKLMMSRCAAEIKSLRKTNAELAPKADAYDTLKQVLNMLPQPSQGYGEDLVWNLEKAIADIEKNQTDEKAAKEPKKEAAE